MRHARVRGLSTRLPSSARLAASVSALRQSTCLLHLSPAWDARTGASSMADAPAPGVGSAGAGPFSSAPQATPSSQRSAATTGRFRTSLLEPGVGVSGAPWPPPCVEVPITWERSINATPTHEQHPAAPCTRVWREAALVRPVDCTRDTAIAIVEVPEAVPVSSVKAQHGIDRTAPLDHDNGQADDGHERTCAGQMPHSAAHCLATCDATELATHASGDLTQRLLSGERADDDLDADL